MLAQKALALVLGAIAHLLQLIGLGLGLVHQN
jgi:hypothetical protein